MDEDALLARLREVEARFPPGGTLGSVTACRQQLADWRQREADIEYRCSVPGAASQRVFGAVCLRYGLIPYRRSRGTSTICVRAPRTFVREILWPQFEAMAAAVEQSLCEVVERVMESWSGVSFDELDRDEVSG
jgi:hypothetical protein